MLVNDEMDFNDAASPSVDVDTGWLVQWYCRQSNTGNDLAGVDAVIILLSPALVMHPLLK